MKPSPSSRVPAPADPPDRWRWTLYVNLAFAAAGLAGAAAFLRRGDRPARRPRLDLPGTVLVSAGLFLLVFGLSMVLLLVVFRSVVIAVKAAAMNLLSICAAYGVLVAVTQWGWLGHAFGFPEQMPVTTWVPVFLFVILFGLSMDYEVFLLSKIREEYDLTVTTGWPSGAGWPPPPG